MVEPSLIRVMSEKLTERVLSGGTKRLQGDQI